MEPYYAYVLIPARAECKNTELCPLLKMNQLHLAADEIPKWVRECHVPYSIHAFEDHVCHIPGISVEKLQNPSLTKPMAKPK